MTEAGRLPILACGTVARLLRHPVGFVAVVQLLAMVVAGPLNAWIGAHLSGNVATVAFAVEAAVVVVLFVRTGWWRRAGRPSRAGLRVAAAIAAVAAAYLILRVKTWHDFSVAKVALAVAGAAAVAAEEELIWRGWVLGTIEPRLGPLKAVLASSALFGIAHLASLFHDASLTWAGFRVVWATCMGMLLAGLLKVSGSYWAPISVHALFNCVDDLDRTTHARGFPNLGATLDMLVAAPVFVLVGAFLCLDGAHLRRRILVAGVCYAALVPVVLAVTPSPTSPASPTEPRVIGLEPSGKALEMNLTFAVPRAWGGRVKTQGSTAFSRGCGNMRIEICVPDWPLLKTAGQMITSETLQFPNPGLWEIEVRYRDSVLWHREINVEDPSSPARPPTPAGAGGR